MITATAKTAATKERYVNIADLHVDESYQRRVSQALVDKIINDYDMRAFGKIVVNRRSDETMWIVNGQHRVLAAARLGLTAVPAQMISGLDERGEAQLRLLTNVAVLDTSMERFYASTVAGDPTALAITSICAEFGLITDARHLGTNENVIRCLATMIKIYSVDGPEMLRQTLLLVERMFGTLNLHNTHKSVISATRWFIANHPYGSYDGDRLIAKASAQGVIGIDRKGRILRSSLGGSGWVNFYRSLVDAYNDQLADKNRLVWVTRARSGKGYTLRLKGDVRL